MIVNSGIGALFKFGQINQIIFLEADYTPVIYVVMYSMDDQFWSVPLNECLSNDDTESYGVVRVESISTLPYVDLTGYTLIWEDDEWKHVY